MQPSDVLRALGGVAAALAPVLPGVGPIVAGAIGGALGLAAQLEDAGVCAGEACEQARRQIAAIRDPRAAREALYERLMVDLDG